MNEQRQSHTAAPTTWNTHERQTHAVPARDRTRARVPHRWPSSSAHGVASLGEGCGRADSANLVLGGRAPRRLIGQEEGREPRMLRFATRLILGATTLALVIVPLPASAASPTCTITGTDGVDAFTEAMQSPATDVVCGLGGDDIFFWSAGDDVYVGGDGRDRVSYANAPVRARTAGVSVDLWNDYALPRTSDRDDIPEIEDVEGSPWADQLDDNPSEANVMLGRGSADVITFAGEGDRVLGNGGPDTIMWHYAGPKVLPEFVSGSQGKDWIATYVSAHGVTIDLAGGTIDSGPRSTPSSCRLKTPRAPGTPTR